ncbi:MAG: hypothetical protein HOG19_15650 [Gammaproteobacteria bacterium]|jgi:hypothetical protein|nr:hypothetical protein [Gammaproteobacteria bacterium]
MKNLKLEKAQNLEMWHVRGSAAPAALGSLSCGAPQMFKINGFSDLGFSTATGPTEFYLVDEKDGSVAGELKAKADDADTFIFPRQDALFVLTGEGWKDMMLRVSAFNFKAAGDDDFVMANMAGVSVWFRVSATDPNKVLFGCDPSFGHYLYETLCDVVEEVKAL